jgi:hypothetical protein
MLKSLLNGNNIAVAELDILSFKVKLSGCLTKHHVMNTYPLIKRQVVKTYWKYHVMKTYLKCHIIKTYRKCHVMTYWKHHVVKTY